MPPKTNQALFNQEMVKWTANMQEANFWDKIQAINFGTHFQSPESVMAMLRCMDVVPFREIPCPMNSDHRIKPFKANERPWLYIYHCSQKNADKRAKRTSCYVDIEEEFGTVAFH